MLQIGGSPGGYFRDLCRELRIDKGDKLWHDLKSYLDIIELAGSKDQLNLGSLASIECRCRRFLSLVEANKTTAGPTWTVAKHITADVDPTDLLTTSFRAEINRKARDAMDAQNFQNRMRTMGRPAENVEEMVGLGSLPSSGGQPRANTPATGNGATTRAAAKRRARKLAAQTRAGDEG